MPHFHFPSSGLSVFQPEEGVENIAWQGERNWLSNTYNFDCLSQLDFQTPCNLWTYEGVTSIPQLHENSDVIETQNLQEREELEDLYHNTAKEETFKTQVQKRKGRKPVYTGLTKRKDVVLKSLLREIRSFYWKRFKLSVQFDEKANRE